MAGLFSGARRDRKILAILLLFLKNLRTNGNISGWTYFIIAYLANTFNIISFFEEKLKFLNASGGSSGNEAIAFSTF